MVMLGATGRNFAAGMSGGMAYVLDEAAISPIRCNKQMVGLEKLEDAEEIEELRQMIQRHADYTKSQRACKILALWERMRAEIRQGHAEGLQTNARRQSNGARRRPERRRGHHGCLRRKCEGRLPHGRRLMHNCNLKSETLT